MGKLHRRGKGEGKAGRERGRRGDSLPPMMEETFSL